MKYACPSQMTWKLAVNALLKVLNAGLPVARQYRKHKIISNCISYYHTILTLFKYYSCFINAEFIIYKVLIDKNNLLFPLL